MDEQISKLRVRSNFSRAAQSYQDHADLQREIGLELQSRLHYLKRAPEMILDLGAGIGAEAPALAKRFPKAHIVALDFSHAMLKKAPSRLGWFRPLHRIAGDMHALPFANASFDLVYSNLALQWASPLLSVLHECRRVLKPQGALLFSSFGSETLLELRRAWHAVDSKPHVHAFGDLAYYGDAMMQAGLRDPVVDNDLMQRHYADLRAIHAALKGIGAVQAFQGSQHGLYGRGALVKLQQALNAYATAQGITMTWEALFGLAFAPEHGQPIRQGGADVASFPLAHLRRKRS
jgi:malonyl-CoA O-methyltransferase